MAFAVVGALVLSGAAYAYASWLAIEATSDYDAARVETTALLAEKGKYTDLRDLAALQQTLTDARQVGALTEVDWEGFYARVLPTLPAGMALESISMDSGSPVEEAVVSAIPGEASGTAKVTFVVTTPNLATAQDWTTALKVLPEYGGSAITSITRDDTGLVTVNVDLVVTDVALSNRFQPQPSPAPEVTVDPAVAEGAN